MEPLSGYHKIKSLSLVAGLLLDPKYHANTLRIEALLHQLVAKCCGSNEPTTKDIRDWLNEYKPVSSLYYLEDPPEDTFVSQVTTKWGDFRVYGGIWESHAFFLQRILNITDTVPPNLRIESLIRPVRALLKVSEEIARRNKARLNHIADSEDKSTINLGSNLKHSRLAETLFFTEDELSSLSCLVTDLNPFILSQQDQRSVRDEEHGLTSLVVQPLIKDGNSKLLVVMPTAISWSIRLYIFKWLRERKMIEKFNENLVLEYLRLLSDLPTYGKFIVPRKPLVPPKLHDAYFLEFASEFDRNRYLHIVVVVDTLSGLEADGINTPPKNCNEQSEEVQKMLQKVYNHFESVADFREGLTLVVLAGYGRARFLGLDRLNNNNWNLCLLGANDLETMAWIPRSDMKTIWKFVKHQNQLEDLKVELQNINGILNLYGWWEQCDHMLIPSNVQVGEAKRTLVAIPTDCLAKVRRRSWAAVDNRSAQYIDGNLKQVRKKHLANYFAEDEGSRLYVSFSDIRFRKIIGCVLTKQRPWWLLVKEGKTSLDPEMIFRIWDAVHNWMEKVATCMDSEYRNSKQGALLFELDISELKPYARFSDLPSELTEGVIANYNIENDKVTLSLYQPFLYFLHTPKNTSEAAVVQCLIKGFMSWANIIQTDANIRKSIELVIPNEGARYIHGFSAKNFREDMRTSIDADYEEIDKSDLNILRIGLGHFSSSGERTIKGKTQCTKYLNDLIDHVYKQLKADLKKFKRKEFIMGVFQNIEGIAAERSQWDRTIKAVIDLRKNKQSVYDAKARHFNRLTTADIACRILIEMAVCECPIIGGFELANFDLSPFMAKTHIIFELGNISDGIEKGEISPEILVTPNGDVKTDQSFREDIFYQMVKKHEDERTQEAIDSYEKNFTAPHDFDPRNNKLENEYLRAVKAEFLVDVDDLRMFLEEIEDIGYKRNKNLFAIRRSEIIEHLKNKNTIAEQTLRNILVSFSLKPRGNWETVRDNDWFTGRDLYPWLFRRRLSLLAKPIVMIEETEDPEYIITPGFCMDAIIYTLDLYRGCGVNVERCATNEMKRWMGNEAMRRGNKFVMEAVDVIRNLGYIVKVEILASTIFPNDLLDKDYGDFDIIAWRVGDTRVYLIECKKLQYAKTFKEVAEQLQEFKGVIRGGKDDRLKKHLDRVTLAQENTKYLTKFFELESDLDIKPVVLFSNPVPVLYDKPRADIKFTHLDEVREFGLD
ncbi:MAG: hypothetical protein RH948_04130 [Cyclobacteriaceae bacterium]